MTQLTILTPFKQIIDDVKEKLNYYNVNLRNELFEIEPNEDNEEAYKRGEIIFDHIDYNACATITAVSFYEIAVDFNVFTYNILPNAFGKYPSLDIEYISLDDAI